MKLVPNKTSNYKAGPGRNPGQRGTYIKVGQLAQAITKSLGVSYEEALAELLEASRQDYFDVDEKGKRLDKQTYVNLMMFLGSRMLEPLPQVQKIQKVDEVEEMSEEELKARALQIAQKLTKDQS